MAEIIRQKKTAKLIAVLIFFILLAGILATAGFSGRAYAGNNDGTVSFTIYHQDRDGKELADTQVFFGHPGDKPVVRSLDIDGYVPQAKQITMTLSSDEEKNVFTFVYQTKLQALFDGGRSLKAAKGDGKAEKVEAPEASSAEKEADTPEDGGTGSGDAEAASAEQDEADGVEDVSAEAVSDISEEDTLDLDVAATPLAAPGQAQMNNVNTMFNVIFAVICLQIVVLLAIWRHVKRKDAAKNKENEA